jgi:hypothetical protein
MGPIRIGEAYYADSEDAMITADCGHRVALSCAEEVWQDGHVTQICDRCFYGEDEA